MELEKEVEDCSQRDGPKSVRGLTASAVIKFNNFFKQNLVTLLVEEARRDQLSQEAVDAPKYSVCFSDLAQFLELQDEVMDRVAQLEEEDESVASHNYFDSNYMEPRSIHDRPIAEEVPQQAHESSKEAAPKRNLDLSR